MSSNITSTQTSAAAPKFKKPVIYKTIEEPKLLRQLLVNDIFLLGGQFAILCQWAHPGLARGTFIHSNFSTRIPNRLQTTARFLNAAVYGSVEEQEAIFSVIHRYHARVQGDGYDANDPELHKWTAATLFVSLVFVHELVFGKLPQDKMEALFRESAVYGTSLRMPPDMWPESLDKFWAYWNHNIETLEITQEARKLSMGLMYPTNLPFHMQAMMPLSRLITMHILPERLAKEYSIEPTAMSTVAFHAVTFGLSTIYPWLPQIIRSRRHQYYREDLTRAVASINRTGHWAGKPKA